MGLGWPVKPDPLRAAWGCACPGRTAAGDERLVVGAGNTDNGFRLASRRGRDASQSVRTARRSVAYSWANQASLLIRCRVPIDSPRTTSERSASSGGDSDGACPGDPDDDGGVLSEPVGSLDSEQPERNTASAASAPPPPSARSIASRRACHNANGKAPVHGRISRRLRSSTMFN